MKTIVVIDHDPAWAAVFEQLRSRIWPVVRDVAIAIEHVGSTAVPGLAAKPVIDISVVVPTAAHVPAGIARLASIGYVHRGNLGVADRDAFRAPGALPSHHLYLCPADSLALRNHLAVRDYLRTHPEAAREYGALKEQLAGRFAHDVEGYVDGKTAMILGMLGLTGFNADELDKIEGINRV